MRFSYTLGLFFLRATKPTPVYVAILGGRFGNHHVEKEEIGRWFRERQRRSKDVCHGAFQKYVNLALSTGCNGGQDPMARGGARSTIRMTGQGEPFLFKDMQT